MSNLKEDVSYAKVLIMTNRNEYNDLPLSTKSNIEILKYMTRDFNPNDDLRFDKDKLNNKEYKDIYDKYILNRRRLNYYKTYINIFCHNSVNKFDYDNILDEIKEMDDNDFKVIDRVIEGLSKYDIGDIKLYRELHGLDDGYEKPINKIAVNNNISVKETKQLLKRRGGIASHTATILSSKIGYLDPKERYDYKSVLNKCDRVLNNGKSLIFSK